MNINVMFKEPQHQISGEETIGFKLIDSEYDREYVRGFDAAGHYYIIPMANVAYLQVPGESPKADTKVSKPKK